MPLVISKTSVQYVHDDNTLAEILGHTNFDGENWAVGDRIVFEDGTESFITMEPDDSFYTWGERRPAKLEAIKLCVGLPNVHDWRELFAALGSRAEPLPPQAHASHPMNSGDRPATASEFFAIALAMLCPVVVISGGAFVCLFWWTEKLDRHVAATAITAAWVVVTALECAVGRFLKRRLDRRPAVSVEQVALEQFVWPLPLRPVAALWWLAHSIAAVWAAGVYADMLRSDARYGLPLVTALFPYAARLAAAFASNLYLLLALAALVRSRRLLRQAWRARLLLDLLLAAALVCCRYLVLLFSKRLPVHSLATTRSR
jgi:hypothetical protein